jgi:hypothetical protein
MPHLLALPPAEETAGTLLVVEENAGKEGLRPLMPASGGRVSPHGSRPGGGGTLGG